jgi:hypothetical protein
MGKTMTQEDSSSSRIVGRVAVFVFSDAPEQLRTAVPDFIEELQHWPMTNPQVSWDAATERLILEVDVTAHEFERFGLQGYAKLVAEEAYKIAVITVDDLGDVEIGVVRTHP